MSDINITVNDEIVNIDVLDTPVLVEVSNAPGPAGAGVAAGGTTGQVLAKASDANYDTEWVDVSGGVWGTITGTLSNQTDLQNALNAKVPYSGATGDVSLGEYGINVGNVIYDTTPTGIPTEQGSTYWDADAETVALIMNGTIQKVGEDTFYHVRNTTGSTIAKGTAVRFSGTTGNSGRLLIAPMLADGTYPSQYYMGITSEEIANNQDGKVYHFGKMRNINTSAFNDGDVLYVSPSVAGALTATAPVAPNNIIVAAAVVHAANNGTLMIRATLGSNINDDEGVLLTTPSANDGLFYDSGLWVNKSITTALGYTPVPTTRNITINGVTYDLSADRTWTIAAGISGSGASGQVTYWTGASAVSGSNNLFWDNTNGRLGIGTNAPANNLEVVGTIYTTSTITSYSADATIRIGTTGASPAGGIIDSIGFSKTIILATNGVRKFQLFNTGNVLIQNGGTFTDLGQRLQVIGDTLLRGSGATNTTTALTVQNSSSTNLFTVRNDGISKFGSSSYFDVSSPLIVGTDGAVGARISIANNSNFQDFQMINTSIASGNINTWSFGVRRDTFFGNTIGSFQFVGAYTNNSGSSSTVGGGYRVPMIFNPNGDVLILGANANVVNGLIGLKVNAPTAHVDITASTTANASLRIRSGTAPTTPNDGDIWFDGTDIKMRIAGVTKTFTLL